ncbi:MAG: squalene/phytoene synthase family protein [PVC group bacterium]
MTTNNLAYCYRVLPRVSRTFALGIGLLKEPLRDTVCVSYLICRILDTIEDTTALPAGERAAGLSRAARELFSEGQWEDCCERIKELFPEGRFTGDDHELCRHSAEVLNVFHGFPRPTREAVTAPVREMAAGMAGTVRRETGDGGLRLETVGDLKQYCHYVAGTVGIMLTDLFSLDRDSITPAVRDTLHRLDGDFGLGLQLTNIIKGVTDDLSRGVAYLPRETLEKAGVTLSELLDRPGDPRGREVIAGLAALALGGLDSALEYTLAIPSREADIRLFCALPLLFAVRTLALAVHSSRVFGEKPLKISRGEVSDICRRLEQICTDDTALRELYRTEKKKTGDANTDFR